MPTLDHAFRTSEHVVEAGEPDRGGVLQSPSSYIGNWVCIWLILILFFYFLFLCNNDARQTEEPLPLDFDGEKQGQ